MTYSLIKVSGLSMSPFFISGETLIIESESVPLSHFKTGDCILIENKVHRVIFQNQVKGDRLIYFDKLNSSMAQKVLGRIYKNNNSFYSTNFNQLILKIISRSIAFISRFNLEKAKARFFLISLIVFLSYTHRILEKCSSTKWEFSS